MLQKAERPLDRRTHWHRHRQSQVPPGKRYVRDVAVGVERLGIHLRFREHDRHLLDLAEYIDWKLQVLEKGTPFDWKAAGTIVESEVSVRPPEPAPGPDFSGGYIGG
jgi:hypothetical protein